MKKYKLIGYQPVGIDYNIPREEIAVRKNRTWCPPNSNKAFCNFVIEKVIEL